MNDATLLRDGDRPILRFERHLPQSRDDVWRTVTDPHEMTAWFPTRIEIDEWKVGASLTHHFDDHDIDPLPGRVIEWEPPHRVRFTWAEDTISFELSPDPNGGTIFVLTEELGKERAARNAAGWDSCLDRLEFAREAETWTSRFDRYSAAFEPVLGPQEGPPESVHVS
jgi:uncharacterized protein YndB with AHSA1/START domain